MRFTVAEYIEAKRLGAPYAGRVGTAKTLQGYGTALKLAERLVGKPIARFEADDATTLLREADAAGYSQAMKNQMVSALKGAFEWAIGNGLYAAQNPFAMVRVQVVQRAHPRVLSQAEIERLVEAIQLEAGEQAEKYVLILSLMGYSGLRIGEALSLRKDGVLADGIRIMGKGRKEAFVPVKPDLLERLRAYIAAHPRTLYVFYGENGIETDKPMGTATVYRVFARARERAGLPAEVRPHTLRHSFATHALRVTKRLEVVQDLLRHADPKTTRWYAQLAKEDLQAEYGKLWGTAA